MHVQGQNRDQATLLPERLDDLIGDDNAVRLIDILAVDDQGGFVVFELKRARSPDYAIGQLARYMGWVQQTIGKGHEVRGIIVAKEIGKNLRYAVSVVPNVNLFEYDVEFHLRLADDIQGNESGGS